MKKKVLKYSFIHKKQELKSIIAHYTSNAKKISLYCCDFKAKNLKALHSNSALFNSPQNLSLNEWLYDHLFKLQKNTDIQIYTYNNLESINVNKPHKENGTNETSYYMDYLGRIYEEDQNNETRTIKICNKSNNNAKILFDFVKRLNKNPNESLSDAVERFLRDNQGRLQHTLEACIKGLQKDMEEEIKNFEELNFLLDQKAYKKKLDECFKALILDIKAICEEGNKQMIKELVSFFFSIVNVFDLKSLFTKSNLALMATDSIFEGAKTMKNILEWANNKYSFTLSNSIIKLLIDDIAPLIYLFQNRILNHTLIIDNRVFIELSGMNSEIYESKADLSQDLALLVEFEEESFNHIKKINLYGMQNEEVLRICTQDHLTKLLNSQITTSENRLAYIETPYFNSSKFVELIKDKEGKNSAEQGYNYLIICNAPYKQNAALNQALLAKLASKAHYNDEKKQELKSEILYKNPKDYDEGVDYSKYKLSIKDEPNKAFVLSLSPFVFVSKKAYNTYKDTKNKLDELSSNIQDDNFECIMEYFDFLKQAKSVEYVLNYEFINGFFTKTLNKKEFLKKEKEFFLQGLECLREYINGIIMHQKTHTRTDYALNHYALNQPYMTIKQTKNKYCALEVLCLSLTWYIIKNFYSCIDTNTQKWWKLNLAYECIEIEGQSLNLLPINSYLGEENPLCFSKQHKKEKLAGKEEVFCIEEFIATLEDTKDQQEYEKAFEELLQEFNQGLNFKENIQDENLKSLEETLKGIEEDLSTKEVKFKPSLAFEFLLKDFINSFFPFSDLLFDLSGFDIGKRLVKAIIRSKLGSFKELLCEELGLAYIIYTLGSKNIDLRKQKAHKLRLNQAINQKAFSQAIELIQKNELETSQAPSDEAKHKGLNFNSLSFLQNYSKDLIKDLAKSLTQNLALNIFNQSYTTHYERIKKEYERLNFINFTYKYLAPYVINREDGVFYPMFINNNFFSFNFNNIIIGGKLCTGAFKELDGLYYSLQNSTLTQTKSFLLNKLLSYLVLDELRAINDKFEKIDDLAFFNARNYKQDLLVRPRSLKLIQDEEDFKYSSKASETQKVHIANVNEAMQNIQQDERRKALYEEYKYIESKGTKKEDPSQPSAIDAYHTAMNYLDDIYNNCFNADLTNNTANQDKHRNFLRALHIIGQNNIKALYVGWLQSDEDVNSQSNCEYNDEQGSSTNDNKIQSEQDLRPKFIGRLAVTIIMKDGLWIG